MSTLVRAPLAIGLLFLSMGASGDGCVASVEVDVKSVCVTRSNVTLGPTNGTSAEASFKLDDFGALGTLAAADDQMDVTRIVVRPAQGTVGSIASARAAISSGDLESSLPTLAMSCDGDCVDADGAIVVPAGLESDIVGYISSGSLVIDLAVTGELPTESWTADIDVCMVGHFAAGI